MMKQKEAKVTKRKSVATSPNFVSFVTFCSTLLVITGCEQIAEEMTGQQEDDAGCAA